MTLPLTNDVDAGRCIIAAVAHTPLTRDTSPEVECRQIESWRHMSAVQKAAIITGLTRAACAMTRAGIRYREPDLSPRQQFLRFALIVAGPDLVCRAYPDAEQELSR